MWVGVGQLGFYLMALVSLTFYVRKSIGQRAWRLIHELSFVMFAMGLMHGLAAGTDSGTWWAGAFYWVTGGSVLFLTVYRVLVTRWAPSPRRATLVRGSTLLREPGEGKSSAFSLAPWNLQSFTFVHLHPDGPLRRWRSRAAAAGNRPGTRAAERVFELQDVYNRPLPPALRSHSP